MADIPLPRILPSPFFFFFLTPTPQKMAVGDGNTQDQNDQSFRITAQLIRYQELSLLQLVRDAIPFYLFFYLGKSFVVSSTRLPLTPLILPPPRLILPSPPLNSCHLGMLVVT